tara:strand:- start:257 stop:517 length:261 start_codon:yes stop_codon:yes gene_type:complete
MRKFLIPLLAAFALPKAVNANDADSFYKQCIIKAIEKTSRQNDYIYSRELARTCACIGNNMVQNLNVRSCPQYGVISKYEIDRYFE